MYVLQTDHTYTPYTDNTSWLSLHTHCTSLCVHRDWTQHWQDVPHTANTTAHVALHWLDLYICIDMKWKLYYMYVTLLTLRGWVSWTVPWWFCCEVCCCWWLWTVFKRGCGRRLLLHSCWAWGDVSNVAHSERICCMYHEHPSLKNFSLKLHSWLHSDS